MRRVTGGFITFSSRHIRSAGMMILAAAGLSLLVSGCGRPMITKLADTSAPVGNAEDHIRSSQPPTGNIPGLVSVTPLPRGDAALEVWLATIDAAEDSIDLKTFIFRPDPVGKLVAEHLFRAADRGVRVRLLVDDLFHFWKGHDLGFLIEHPGVSVKIYNPLDRVLPPPFNYLLEYERVNARLHSKALIIDHRLAIIGGRNVGAEYFKRSRREYFSDFDVLVRGDNARVVQESFDLYWNDRLAIGYRAVLPGHEKRTHEATPPKPAPLAPVLDLDQVLAAHVAFEARMQIFSDAPDDARIPVGKRENVVRESVFAALSGAQESVFISTPYFIPEQSGAELLAGLARRGVQVHVLTNSLGSTNHPSVYAGYLRSRDRLLQAGVQIHEFREDASHTIFEDGRRYQPHTTLHSKLIVIDGKMTITGSMNFDPRSLRKNSEIAVCLESAPLSKWLQSWIEQTIRQSAYTLEMSKDGRVTWASRGDSGVSSRDTEPNTSLGKALVALFFGITQLDTML